MSHTKVAALAVLSFLYAGSAPAHSGSPYLAAQGLVTYAATEDALKVFPGRVHEFEIRLHQGKFSVNPAPGTSFAHYFGDLKMTVVNDDTGELRRVECQVSATVEGLNGLARLSRSAVPVAQCTSVTQ